MNEFDDLCVETFLEEQGRLFDEPVADTADEAREFLEDCGAMIFDSSKELRAYWDEEGIDYDDNDPEDALEVFKMQDGRILYVEG